MLFDAADIRSRVDRLLAVDGEYRPCDLLMDIGRLAAADFEDWRQDQGTRLADHLYGDPVAIGKELAVAADYARNLGLKSCRSLDDRAVGHPPGLPDGWATTTWVRRSVPQMDLFFDGQATTRLRDLVEALVAHDRSRAEQALGVLERSEPGDPLVAAAPRLIAALDLQCENARRALAEMEKIDELAESRLGRAADDFLTPLWRRFAHSLEQQTDAGVHPSVAWARIADWRQVVSSLGDDPEALSGPELLARGVRAHYRLGDYRTAVQWLCRLCWRFPEMVSEISQLAGHELDLDTALEGFEDRELDRSWGWQELPTWLLLNGYVASDWQPEAAPESFRALSALMAAPTDMAARERLHAAAPGALREFLSMR